MLDGIKKWLIHFETDGRCIVTDFVAARQKRARLLRRVIHVCFYFQCAAALVCVICGFAMGGAVTGVILLVGAAAASAAALAAVSGDPVVGTVNYVLNIVYSVICFIIGGALFTLCGVLMLAAALAALCGFGAGCAREFLLEYPPSRLVPEDYTLTGEPPQEAVISGEPTLPLKPEPEPKSELLQIAERVAHIMNTPQEAEGKEQAEQQ